MTDASRPLVAALRLCAIGAIAAALGPIQAILNRHSLRRAERLARHFHCWAGALLGLEIRIVGEPSTHRPTLYCANRASYLDIVVLGSVLDTSFVAKREVDGWPVIGILARLQRKVFVDRRRQITAEQVEALRAHLRRGENLVLFPEGTSSEGRHVLPFKSAMFAAAEPDSAGDVPLIQPVWIAYRALDGRPLDATTRTRIAWYGDMTLLPHLFRLAGQRRLAIELGFAPAVPIAFFANRKTLASHCESRVAEGLARSLAGPCWWETERKPALLDSPRSGAIVVK